MKQKGDLYYFHFASILVSVKLEVCLSTISRSRASSVTLLLFFIWLMKLSNLLRTPPRQSLLTLFFFYIAPSTIFGLQGRINLILVWKN